MTTAHACYCKKPHCTAPRSKACLNRAIETFLTNLVEVSMQPLPEESVEQETPGAPDTTEGNFSVQVTSGKVPDSSEVTTTIRIAWCPYYKQGPIAMLVGTPPNEELFHEVLAERARLREEVARLNRTHDEWYPQLVGALGFNPHSTQHILETIVNHAVQAQEAWKEVTSTTGMYYERVTSPEQLPQSIVVLDYPDPLVPWVACQFCKKLYPHHHVRRVPRPEHCPTCHSHDPALHPAMQHGGEVQPCSNTWHQYTSPLRMLQAQAATHTRVETDTELLLTKVGKLEADAERIATALGAAIVTPNGVAIADVEDQLRLINLLKRYVPRDHAALRRYFNCTGGITGRTPSTQPNLSNTPATENAGTNLPLSTQEREELEDWRAVFCLEFAPEHHTAGPFSTWPHLLAANIHALREEVKTARENRVSPHPLLELEHWRAVFRLEYAVESDYLESYNQWPRQLQRYANQARETMEKMRAEQHRLQEYAAQARAELENMRTGDKT